MSNHKATYWIKALDLQPHPEGGYFKRTIESDRSFEINGTGERKLFSAIYYLLESNDHSAFHKLRSDEIWNFYAGEPLTIYILSDKEGLKEIILGDDIEKGEQLQVLIERDQWFAAKPKVGSSFSLVGCTVVPGFDFNDWELGKREALIDQFPQHTELINRLTTSFY